jgi:cytoskeleton protein RodZ
MSATADEISNSSSPPKTAGAMLAAVRQAQGLDVTEISSRLRLSTWQVEALESDQYGRLAGATFIRGIIRNYAKTLQIDPESALDAYSRAVPVAGHVAIDVPSQNIRFQPGASREWNPAVRTGLILLTLAVAIGGAWIWYTMPAGVIGKPPAPVTAKPAEPAPEVAPPSAPTADAPTAASASAASPPSPRADTSPIAAEPAKTAAPQVDSAPAKPVATPAAPPGQPALHFSFTESAWVEVRDGTGRIVFSQLNAPGSEEIVTGKPPFSLVVGNAAHVDLTYNDKPVDLLPHVRVRVARLTVK